MRGRCYEEIESNNPRLRLIRFIEHARVPTELSAIRTRPVRNKNMLRVCNRGGLYRIGYSVEPNVTQTLCWLNRLINAYV